MKMRIEFTKTERMTLQSLANLFEDEPLVHKNYQKVREYADSYEQITEYNEDGSLVCTFSAGEIVIVSVLNWCRDIISSCKGLIFSAVDTYKNLVKMMGIRKLEIDGEETTSYTPVKINITCGDVVINAKRYVATTSDMKKEEEKLESDVRKAFDATME